MQARHPHGLVLRSLCFLWNCMPTASLVIGVIVPTLQMGKLRLGVIEGLGQVPTARKWQRLAGQTQKPYEMLKNLGLCFP